MSQVAQAVRGNTDNRVKLPNVKEDSVSTLENHDGPNHHTYWEPPALRPAVLITTIVMCWTLIAALQIFLIKSQREGGVLFATKISDLPFRQQFLYLYLPTVIAVLFSIYWAWIDLETKRMEPYYQMSKVHGALAKDSVLLHYPFDFIPFVPFRAARDRHWPVFWGSFAVLLVTFGVVPMQAGIFSVETIFQTSEIPFVSSTAFMPAEVQAFNLTMRFSQSAYGIVLLNETLPGFMARNFTLAPFWPATGRRTIPESQTTWTAKTTMYSLDMYCEPAIVIKEVVDNKLISVHHNSSAGCNFRGGLTGNLTKGSNGRKNHSPLLDVKDYTAMYVPYWNNGFADWSLDHSCASHQNATFYAAFAKNKDRAEDPPNKVSAIFCYPDYYQQEVYATVNAFTQAPLKVVPMAAKEPLQPGIFNQTSFEQQIGSGASNYQVRGNNLPGNSVPDYLEKIADTQVSLQTGSVAGSIVLPMVGLALAVNDRPLADYLDWTALSKSYADAYRLLFARAMVDILGENTNAESTVIGNRQDTTQAVILEPVFTYIVEGLLGAISIATFVLLYISLTRKRKLRSDPSSIASLMALVADNDALLAFFEDLDCCTVSELRSAMGESKFRLVDDGHHVSIEIVGPAAGSLSTKSIVLPQPQSSSREIAKPIRPVEFSLWMSILFVGLFVGLAVSLAIFFAQARDNGLSLPSKNRLVQNILENYIPTVLATLIEPMWVLINRLLCMLQPIEQLRACKAEAKDSINANYSSLPPQLILFKALRSKHFVLAAVCAMALLANLLAIAFAGIFNQDMINVSHPTSFDPPFEMKFISINGSIGPKPSSNLGSLEPSGAFRGGNAEDQFLIAESNVTRGTPLPAWTDETMFYLPFMKSDTIHTGLNAHYRTETTAFGAQLDCDLLKAGVDYQGIVADRGTNAYLEFNVTSPSSSATICPSNAAVFMQRGPSRTEGPRTISKICQNGPSAAEVMFYWTANANATQAEKDACMSTVVMGWIRAPDGTCGAFEDRELTDSNAAFTRCKPRLVTGRASVQVDAAGVLQEPAKGLEVHDLVGDLSQIFSNDPINLIGQSNSYIFKFGVGQSLWHNDSHAADYMNYFALRESNSSRLVDPTHGPPSLEDIQKQLGKAYSKIFAIWLGANKEKLLVPLAEPDHAAVNGWTVVAEQRLFISTPMFIISETILITYIVVAVMVYLRRPGRYLAHMPTSIGSIVSLFAASSAVRDMKGTSYLNKKGRADHFRTLDSRYGYGSYIGGSGGGNQVHIGIEKVPFVRVRKEFAKKNISSHKIREV